MHPVTKSRRKQEVVVVPAPPDRRPVDVCSKCMPQPRVDCVQGCSDKCEVITHPGTHTGKKLFICPYEDCGLAFAVSGALKRHLRVHAGKKPFACSYEDCGLAFAASGDLKIHKRVHSGEKPFACPYGGCGYASARARNLTRHFLVHTGEKPLACPYGGCGYTSGRSSDLTRHFLVHTGEKPFVCQQTGCGRAFTQSGHLACHLRVHRKEKPFVCQQTGCGRAFAQSGHLACHLRVHRKEKLFVCQHRGCGHAFVRSSNLLAHLRIHAGEKPFICPCEGCDYASIRSNDLKRHLRTHAKAKPAPMAMAASPGVGADPAPERGRQGSCVSSDSPAVITTVLATGHQLPDVHGTSPARSEPLSPWFGLPASPSSQAAELLGLVPERASSGPALSQDSQPGCAPAVSMSGELVPGGSRWHADDALGWLLQPSHTTQVPDPHLLSFSCADDDNVFWQKLISLERQRL